MFTNSPLRSSDGGLTEFHGGLPKSPMRDRFLDDLVKSPMESRDASRSPMRGRGGSYEFDRDGINSPARSSNVSRSPVRGRGRTPLSVRTRDASRSPMMEGSSLGDLDSFGRSIGGSINGDVTNSPLRGTEEERIAWASDDKHEGFSGENYSGGRRRTWRDRVEDRPDQIREGVKYVLSDEHGMDRGKGGMYGDGRFKSPHVGGHGRPNVGGGPSDYHPDPIHGYGDPRHNFETARGPASLQEIQQQREELLRKYNELEDQLNGLDDAEVSSQGFYNKPNGYSVDESSKLRHGPMQHFPPNRNVERPSHFRREPGLAHNREDMYDVSRPIYEDQYAGHIKRGPRFDQHLPDHSVPGIVPRRSVNSDHRDSYVNDWQGRDPHSSLPHVRHDKTDLDKYGPPAYDLKVAHNGAREQSSHSVHLNRRLELASMNKRLCRPISRGAPFVICNNCFELLILPGNFIAKHKNQQLKCGACSTIVSFDLHLKSFDPLSPQKMLDSVHVTPRSGEKSNESLPKHRHSCVTATSTNFGSYDFDAGSSVTSRSTNGHKFNPSLGDNNLGFASSPSRCSVDEHISDAAIARSSQPNSSEMPMTFPPSGSVDGHISGAASFQSSQPNSSEMPMMISPLPESPLHSHIDGSSPYHIPKSAEQQIIDKDTSLDGPIDITDATETEVPFNEGPTTGETQYSGDIPRESPVSGNDKVAKSRIDDLLKGLESVSSHGSSNIAKVYVNGQAISNRSVKMAEKFAGPIQPGEYWYDPKAGFWGVMGHRCLGIIPPFIQEFSLPMPENCSRGDSAVYVNGRELPKKDLDLLAGRKLPTTRNKRYIVDISGKVLDEQTKDFVVRLGRLAPTVEKKKCGFGMQVPEQLDD